MCIRDRDYIAETHPDLVPLYDEIYNKHNRSYFDALEVKAEKMAKKYDCCLLYTSSIWLWFLTSAVKEREQSLQIPGIRF